MMFRDAAGIELEVGDTVAYNPPYYKGLVVGRVLKIAKVQVIVGDDGKVRTEGWKVPCNAGQRYSVEAWSVCKIYGDRSIKG